MTLRQFTRNGQEVTLVFRLGPQDQAALTRMTCWKSIPNKPPLNETTVLRDYLLDKLEAIRTEYQTT